MILTKYAVVCNMTFLMYTFFIFLTLHLLRDNNYVLKVWNKNDYAVLVLQTLRDHKQNSLATIGFKTPTFLCVEVVTLNTALFKILERPSSGNIINFFCLVNWFTISRLSIFLWRCRKTKVSKKTVTTKINNIKKGKIWSFHYSENWEK